MTLGQTVWVFDANRRVYVEGRSGPVYSHHFIAVEVVGQTSRSWLLKGRGLDLKADKATGLLLGRVGPGLSRRVYASAQEVEDACWMHDNRQALDRAVRSDDCSRLRVVYDLLTAPPEAVARVRAVLDTIERKEEVPA